jgi:NADH:ubiquinone oxidoreductase subunit C
MSNMNLLNKTSLSKDLQFTSYLSKIFPPILIYSIKGEIYCKVSRKSNKHFLIFLKYHSHTLFKQLIDLYAVDFNERFQRFELCYNLLSLVFHRRINVTLAVSERQIVDSIIELYPNAS